MTALTPDTIAVQEIELARVRAMVASDIDMLDTLLHDDLIFGHTNGHADDKTTYLAKFQAKAVRYFDAHHHVDNVRIFGNTALVKSDLAMKVELESGILQLKVLALTVWVLELGSWKMVAHQPTVVSH